MRSPLMTTSAAIFLALLVAAPAAALADRDEGWKRDRSEQRSERAERRSDREERKAESRRQWRDDSQHSQPKAHAARLERSRDVKRQQSQQREHRQVNRDSHRYEQRSQHAARSDHARVVRQRRYYIDQPSYRRNYRYQKQPRSRFYMGVRVNRHYGHRYPGFAYFYRDHDALRFLALTALTLAIIDHVDESSQRLHEHTMVRATTLNIGETAFWRHHNSSGEISVIAIWYDARGRECREIRQTVRSFGRSETGYHTIRMGRNGRWAVVGS